MKILITGATGSLGAFLTRYFSQKGHKIIATGRSMTPPPLLARYATYLRADITESFNFPKVDVVIHTAALSDDKAALSDLLKANVEGTRKVLDASSSSPKFIHISSSSVYVPAPQPILESETGSRYKMSLAPYGQSKLLSEEVVKKEAKQAAVYILRPRVLYGVGDKVILPRMLKFVAKDKLQYPGELKNKLSMTHYENLGHAIDLCIQSEKTGIHTYNVADDEEYIMIEILRLMTEHLYGRKLDEKRIPLWIPKLMAYFKIGGITPLLIRATTMDMTLDLNKIKSELGYAPKATMYNQIQELSDWVKQIGGIEVILSEAKRLAWEV